MLAEALRHTVEAMREEGRRVLKVVNKTIVDRVRQKRHVFVEQPRGSSWLSEPELSGVHALIESGDLIVINAAGCMLGYIDRESGLPHCKPTTFVTTLLTAESVFSECRCPGNHEHEPLQGSNRCGRRTAQAATWPPLLNEKVLEAIAQQASVEEYAHQHVQETFANEGGRERLRVPKRRRPGRVSVLADRDNAPPVYLRPGDVEPVPPDDATDRTLAELIDEPSAGQGLPCVADGDDASHRAIMTGQLGPTLSISEQDRRRKWLELSADIRKCLRDLHVQFRHPTNTTLQRILRRQGARPEAIRGVDFLACDACGESHRRRRPKPVRLPGKYEFNAHIQVNVFYCKDVRAQLFSFLNVICEATGFQVVSCMGLSQGPPAARVVLRHFLTSWSSWAGLPGSLQVDRGKEFMAHFADYLKSFGVEQEAMSCSLNSLKGAIGGLERGLL